MDTKDTPDFKTNWERWRAEIKKQYPDFKDEDLLYKLGEDEKLLERLQMKTGKTKKEIFNWLHLMG